MRFIDALAVALFTCWAVPAAAQSTQKPTAPTPPVQKPTDKPPLPAPDTPQAAAAGDEENTGWVGFIDVGVRASSIDGDAARYERYRDLGDGLFLETVRINRDARGWLFDLDGDHVGRDDQRLVGTAHLPARVKGRFFWDQIPMTLSTSTKTLFTGVGTGQLSEEDALQLAVQTVPAAIAPVFNQFGQTFDTKTRRHVADGAVEFTPNEELTVTTHYRHTDREGTIPFGGSFGHSSLVETSAPTNHTLSDFDVSTEWVRDPVILRGGYAGSWFNNDVTSLIFDNPFRATDIPATSSRGRLTLPPSNSFINLNGMASIKLPGRSRAMAYGSIGMLEDAGDAMVPQTINSSFPTQPLERTTVQGEARTSSMNLRFTSRPSDVTDFQVSYRTYEYDNRSPEFLMRERVSFDNGPAAVVNPPVPTEAFSVERGTFDADFRFTPKGRLSAGLGYTRVGEERTHRIFESTADDVVRVVFDAMTKDWFSVRTKYEHARRRGEGIEEGEAELIAIGEHKEMRHFDVADRDRDRVTIIGTFAPSDPLSASVSIAAGKDDYIDSLFGVRDATHRVYSAGADYVFNENASVGLSYSFEKQNALQRSRQANPGVQFDDPSRNWALDTTDKSHSLMMNVDVARIKEKVGLRLAYDFSRGRGRYVHITGPVPDRTLPEEVPVPTTLPPPSPLPDTNSEFHRATADLTYAFTNRISIGASYWYDQYRVSDFTLDIDAQAELARGQALLMGYMYRPYTANTGWVRLLYRW
jgi:MtrB/PioB family decaheme-associated outer membrane protein